MAKQKPNLKNEKKTVVYDFPFICDICQNALIKASYTILMGFASITRTPLFHYCTFTGTKFAVLVYIQTNHFCIFLF